MPIHEYQCDVCGHRFEAIQKFSDPPIETCPKCGGHVQKLISAPAFQFKGTGWYITDYAKKDSSQASSKSEPAMKADSKDAAPAKTESASKTETPASSPSASTTKNE